MAPISRMSQRPLHLLKSLNPAQCPLIILAPMNPFHFLHLQPTINTEQTLVDQYLCIILYI